MELKSTLIEVDGVEIKEVSCKTALSKSGLEADYSLNPYRGCTHGCIYCYSSFVIGEDRPWGEFLDVKRNIPKVLHDELDKKDRGIVRLGSVTDPYQEAERHCKLTRRCLKQLGKKDLPVLIQTKSDLVTRDIDILDEMEADIGFTITSLDDEFRKRFEPEAPSIGRRLSAARELSEEGLNVWAFIGPILPFENDREQGLKRLKETLNSIGIEEIYLDKLNMREGIWREMQSLMDEEMEEKYKKIYFGDDDHFEEKREFFESIGKTVF